MEGLPFRTSRLEDDALLVKSRPSANDWSERIDELLEIRQLENDWDGLGAKAPSTALLDSALQLAEMLRSQAPGEEVPTPLGQAPSRIVPGRAGAVIFEWQVDDACWELEITAPHEGELVIFAPGQPTQVFGFEW